MTVIGDFRSLKKNENVLNFQKIFSYIISFFDDLNKNALKISAADCAKKNTEFEAWRNLDSHTYRSAEKISSVDSYVLSSRPRPQLESGN